MPAVPSPAPAPAPAPAAPIPAAAPPPAPAAPVPVEMVCSSEENSGAKKGAAEQMPGPGASTTRRRNTEQL